MAAVYGCDQGPRGYDASGFIRREIKIWKSLRHTNVLELYGASSACGDPPWFFVSPYLKNGSLVNYLKGVAAASGVGRRETDNRDPDVDMLKMMYEIAKGMAYLHENDVLHGDLKVRPLSSHLSIYR